MPLSSVGISSVQQEEYYIVLVRYRLNLLLKISLLEITSLEITHWIWLKLQKNIHTNYKDGIYGNFKKFIYAGEIVYLPGEESIEETQGVRMLEQHIRDVKLNSIKPENLALICWHG